MSRFSPAASLAGRRKESPHEDNIEWQLRQKRNETALLV